MTVGFFFSTTSRVTCSTSVSCNSIVTGKRPCSLCKRPADVRAFCPVATNITFDPKREQHCSCTSCTALEPIRAFADVLLHFVQHDQRAGQLAFFANGLLDLVDHLVNGNVVDLRELLLEQQFYVGGFIGEIRASGQDCLGDRDRRRRG